MSIKFTKVEGLAAATPTAFNSDGSLNLLTIPKQIEALKNLGVHTHYVLGTTGEGVNLTVSERGKWAEEWIKQTRKIDPQAKVILHIGTSNINDSITLANHAQELAVDAIAAIPPYYFKPESVQDLVETMAVIAAACSKIPFYYYHFPERTGVNFKLYDFLNEVRQKIPNLVGAKFTHNDLVDAIKCIHFSNKKYDILLGNEELFWAGLKIGITGAVGCSFSFKCSVDIFNNMMKYSKENNDEKGQQEQLRAILLIELMKKRGLMGSIKAMMKMQGIDVGAPRLPIKSLVQTDYESLLKDLLENGLTP